MQKIYFGKNTKKIRLFLIIYDISSDKERTKVAKILESYGKRVQMSAFECWLNEAKYNRLNKELQKYAGSSDIRIYHLLEPGQDTNGNILDDSVLADVYIS